MNVDKHIAQTTVPVMKSKELAKLKAMKAAKNFLKSWSFTALAVLVGASVMIVGQSHQGQKVDRQAVSEHRLPVSTIK